MTRATHDPARTALETTVDKRPSFDVSYRLICHCLCRSQIRRHIAHPSEKRQASMIETSVQSNHPRTATLPRTWCVVRYLLVERLESEAGFS